MNVRLINKESAKMKLLKAYSRIISLKKYFVSEEIKSQKLASDCVLVCAFST